MIFTVTLNPAIDKTVVIPSFRVDTVNRIGQMRIDVGGKGINVSKCLKNLGLDSTAAAFLGGAGGVQSLELMKEAGLKPLIVDVPGGDLLGGGISAYHSKRQKSIIIKFALAKLQIMCYNQSRIT